MLKFYFLRSIGEWNKTASVDKHRTLGATRENTPEKECVEVVSNRSLLRIFRLHR